MNGKSSKSFNDQKNLNNLNLLRLMYNLDKSLMKFIFTAILIFCMLMTFLFPIFKDIDGIGLILDNSWIKLFLPREAQDYLSFPGYLTLQVVSIYTLIYALITIFLGISFAGDIESGSVEMLLSHNIERRSMVFSKWLYSEILMFLLILPGIIGIYIGSIVLSEKIDIITFSIAFVGIFIMYSALLGIGFLLSVLLFDRIYSLAAILSFYFFFRFIGYMTQIANEASLDPLGNTLINILSILSIFNYYNASDYIFEKIINPFGIIFLIIIIISTVLLSVFIFERKDIPVKS